MRPSLGDERAIDVPGLRLALRVWGPEDGLPTVALHGWLDNAASFDGIAPLLPSLRLYALDLPGHGRSQHRAAGAFYHFVDYVADVLAAAESLGLERFVLIGHSMGAGIASLVAGTMPERVRGLIMLDGMGPLASPPEEMPTRLAQAVRERQRNSARQLRPYVSLEQAAEQRQKVVGELSLASARRLVERGMVRTDAGYVWSSDPRLRGTSPMRMDEWQALAFLRRITAPSLLIRPRQGFPFDEDIMRARIEAIAGLEVVTVDGGHHAHMDHPETVAGVIARFCERLG